MMFCLKCEEEFPDTAPTCRDCNVELVSSLKEDEFPELALICTILNEATAYIIRGFLENENIPCQLKIYPFMQSLLRRSHRCTVQHPLLSGSCLLPPLLLPHPLLAANNHPRPGGNVAPPPLSLERRSKILPNATETCTVP